MTDDDLKQKYPEVYEAFEELERLQNAYNRILKIRDIITDDKPCTQESEKENEQPTS